MEALEFVAVVPWEIVVQLINLALMILLLRHFLLEPVQRILAQREQEIQQEYAQAAQASEQAERTKQQYEQHMAAAKEQAARVEEQAEQRARRREADIVHTAQQQAHHMMERAAAGVEHERRRVRRSLQKEASVLAMELAGRVVGRELTARDHDRLIQQCIDGLGEEAS